MLGKIAAPGAPFAGELDEQPLTGAVDQMRSAFDSVHGGTQGAPKFPRPADMELLIRLASQPGGEPAREMLETTLDAMAAGGLNDHLGGGFFRYSVDARWEIPHFEKMLYDNAALLSAYALAFQFTGRQRYAEVADATAAWLLRDMRHEGGAFFAALDADSEGEEGLYYPLDTGAGKGTAAPGRIRRLRGPLRTEPQAQFRGKFLAPDGAARA